MAADGAVGPEDADDSDYFELMIARFKPKLQTEECRIKTGEELDDRLARVLAEPQLAIGLGFVEDGAGWGYFLLLLNGERAWIHLMEGPCVTGRDSKVALADTRPVRFRDDVGVWHEVPFKDTITREQGVQALRHWLPRGEKLPELTWVWAT
jgi:hypothetical protein